MEPETDQRKEHAQAGEGTVRDICRTGSNFHAAGRQTGETDRNPEELDGDSETDPARGTDKSWDNTEFVRHRTTLPGNSPRLFDHFDEATKEGGNDLERFGITSTCVRRAVPGSFAASQRGMLPCFFGGRVSRFVRRTAKDLMTRGLVSGGSITSSRYPMRAAM